jgi:MFS family permease
VRAWVVWTAGLLAYVVAVLDRTTLGVSGLDAAERFSAGPGVLSTFVVLQVVVYAGMQIPAGLLLDRYGSKALIVAGSLIMAAGQMTLALTEALPAAIIARALVGAGDAFTFISVLRLVPRWFAPERVPLVTQLTGILGQLGQVLSAVPFLALLNGPGWTAAYTSAAALGVLAAVLALALIRNEPPGTKIQTEVISVRGTLRNIRAVWARPGTRLGFFTHMGTQFSITVFALMWGIPYLTTAQNFSAGAAGALLSASVVSIIVAGVVIGVLTGRFPKRRSWLVLGIMASNAAIWTVVLVLPAPAPPWLLVVLVLVVSVGGPASVVGFDFARTFNPSKSLGTAQGMVNMGGFLVSLLVMQAMGMIIGAMGGYSFDSFRVAWTVQYLVWLVATIGIVTNRRAALREMARERRTAVVDLEKAIESR